MLDLAKLPFNMVIITLMGAFIMPFLSRWFAKVCRIFALAVSMLIFTLAIILIRGIFGQESLNYFVGGWSGPWGIAVKSDALGALFLLLIPFIIVLVLIYADKSIAAEIDTPRQGWYYNLILLCMAGMMGLTISNDLFNMYVMIEVTSLSACALVFAGGSKKSFPAALKYLFLATIGSGFILFGIGFIYMLTGHLNLDYALTNLASNQHSPYLTWMALAFFVVGLGVKGGLFPLHFWLPDAHSTAPTTSSAILSGLVVKVYVVVIIRLIYVLHTQGLLQTVEIRGIIFILGSLAIIGGSFFALIQTDLKRLLAYSTVAQIGYIFMGLGLMNKLGIMAALFHVVAHALMKSLLFLAAGNLIQQAGGRTLEHIKGLGRIMPITAATFTIGAFSMIGIPLFAGFITKYFLVTAGFESNSYLPLIIIVFSGLLNAAYYMPLIVNLFLDTGEPFRFDQVPLSRLIPLALLSLMLIILGLIPQEGLTLLKQVLINLAN